MHKALLALAASLALASQAPAAFAQVHDHGSNGAATDVQTTPADGARGAAPQRFTAAFAHAMRLKSLVVTPQGGDPMSVDLSGAAAGATVSAPLPRLAPGHYTIVWTTSGDDNHTMTGRVRFMVY
jgi:methionine-rich copper-binding protein CopC